MADSKTWADVAHTAVQVGLAALIGGGFTLLATALNTDRQRKQELVKRRLELLETACTEINLYFDQLTNVNSILRRELRSLEAGNPLRFKDQLDRNKAELFERSSGLFAAEAKLQILREKSCTEMYRKFFSANAAYADVATIGNESCTIEILHQRFDKIVAARAELLDALGRAYTRSV